MGFNYIEYVKRGSNPLLKEEHNPIKPPTSESGLKIWIKQKYNISEDDVATLFLNNPDAIEEKKFRTVEAIEAALKREGIEFKSLLNTPPADNTATDDDAAALREKWNGMKNLLRGEFTKVRQEIEEKFDIDVNINDQQDFLKSNAYKSFADPNKDQNTLYKERIEAMSVYFEDPSADLEKLVVNADKLEEDFKDFLRERGYGSLQDVGPENRPDDYEEKENEEQPEEPQKVNKEAEVAKQEIVEDLTDKSKPFNLSEKLDSIASYLAQKGKELFADTEEEILKEQYEKYLKSMQEVTANSQNFGDEDINEIFNRLYYLKFVEYTPLQKFKSLGDSTDSEFQRFLTAIRREVYSSDAIGITKGLIANLGEPQLGQILNLIYNNLENIAMQNEGWDNSDNILTSIFADFKEQTGLNLQDYLPNDINLNIPPTAYEGRVEELEELLPDGTLYEIKSLTSSDNEYKEVLAQYSHMRLTFKGATGGGGALGDKYEILPELESVGEKAILKDIVEFVNTPFLPYNNYASYWVHSFVGSEYQYNDQILTSTSQINGIYDPVTNELIALGNSLTEEYYGIVVNMIAKEIVTEIDPENQSVFTEQLLDKEVQSFIKSYLKFNFPITKSSESFTRNIVFNSSSEIKNLSVLGNMESTPKFENDIDMILEGLLPSLNKLFNEKLGTDISIFNFLPGGSHTIINNLISSPNLNTERNKELIADIIEKQMSAHQRNINLKNDLISSYEKAIDSIKELDSKEIQKAASAVMDALNRGDIDGAERARTALSMMISEQNGVGLVEKLMLWNKINKEKEAVELIEMFMEDIKKLDLDNIDFHFDSKFTPQSGDDINSILSKDLSDYETDLPTDTDDDGDVDVDPLQELIKGSITSLLLEQNKNSEINLIEVMNYSFLIGKLFSSSQNILNKQITLFNNFDSVERSKDSIYNFATNEYKNYLNLINSVRIPSFESINFYERVELGLTYIEYLEQVNDRMQKKFSK